MPNIIIDKEFRDLIHPLDPDEYKRLEVSILEEGCRDALVFWHNGEVDVLIDGHNRYEICTQYKLPFNKVYRQFDNRDDVMNWMDTNQLARRNVNKHWRVVIADRLSERIAKKAKANQVAHLKQGNESPVLTNLSKRESINTREEVAKKASVSEGTVHKVKTIEAKAPAIIREKARNSELSSNKAYELTKAYETIPESVQDVVLNTSIATDVKEIEALAKLPKDKQPIVAQKVASGEAESIKEAQKQQARKEEIDTRTKLALEIVEKPDNYVQGDCLEVLKTLEAKSVKLLLTDPPYGTNFQSNRRTETAQLDKISNDESPELAAKLLEDMLATIDPAMQDDCHLLIFTSQQHYPLFRDAVESANYKCGRVLTWVKENHTSGYLRVDFAPQTEWIIHAWRGSPLLTPRISEVLNYSRASATSHPTEKPIELLSKLIEVCTVEGELIVDPFAGTGNTVLSAVQLNRKVLGVELSENWFNEGLVRINTVNKKVA